MRYLRTALGLLTILPLAPRDDWRAGDSGRAAAWYPFVGLAIGSLTWLTLEGARLLFPWQLAGVLTLAVWVGLTGGLHLDGLADCCDGLFVSASRERRLEIMQDARTGAFGVVGLIVVLLLKAAALGALPPELTHGILPAACLARGWILPAALFPIARPGGMAADFTAGLTRSSIFIGALLPLGLAFVLGTRGLVALLAGSVAAVGVLLFARARLGGVTGDVFGMLVEVVETVVLLVYSVGY